MVKKAHTLVVFSLLFITFFFAPLSYGIPEAPEPISPAQKTAIEKIIRNYLIKNPEVLIEASQVLRTRQQEKMQAHARQNITENSSALFSSKSPVAGNVNGNVNLVEFFDYQCSHCKRMAPIIQQLITSDKDLRVIFKQMPIFGDVSEFAAKAALAADKQGKYFAFHEALMHVNGKLTQDKVMKIARSVKLNRKRLRRDMKRPEIADEIKANMKLAENIGIMGTPAFIVASHPPSENMKSYFIPGAAPEETLQKFIQQAR